MHDDESMRVAILGLVPVGTSVTEAAHRLAQHGLICAQTSQAKFRDRGPFTYALCQGRSAGVVTFREWKIALVESGGRVADILVSSGLTGL